MVSLQGVDPDRPKDNQVGLPLTNKCEMSSFFEAHGSPTIPSMVLEALKQQQGRLLRR